MSEFEEHEKAKRTASQKAFLWILALVVLVAILAVL